jgi:hypothetical protein
MHRALCERQGLLRPIWHTRSAWKRSLPREAGIIILHSNVAGLPKPAAPSAPGTLILIHKESYCGERKTKERERK